MIDAYAVSDVRAAEESAMAGLPGGELMRRAAAGLAAVVGARLRERGGSRVVALVGPGDNGGDALYAVARLAAEGHHTSAVTVAARAHEGGLTAARDAGVRLVDGQRPGPGTAEMVGAADVVLDGILGIGGRPGLAPPVEALVDQVPDTAYVIAVDLPSGADPAGERSVAGGVYADETVTFGAAKPVHLLPAGEVAVGRLTVVDIGVGTCGVPAVQRLTHDDVGALWPRPGPQDDKYSRGVVGVVAGGESYTGAAVLCVSAAVCAGAGMVRYVGPPTPTSLVRAQVPEAVTGTGRVQAWVLGPGLDAHDESADGLAQVQTARTALDSGTPCVVDAGALDLLTGARSTPTLLTPHAGELARLLSRLDAPVDRGSVAGSPLVYLRRAADLTGATVLLKGSTTLVAAPSDEGLAVRSQADAPPWLATAGAGDVLAGLAGTLLAAGLSPLDAGSLAALVHGRSGEAANPGGPVRALAVAHAIPGVVAALLARSGRPS